MLSRTASVGLSAIMGVEMATSQDFANWICSARLRPKFLLYALRSMDGEFRRLRMGSTHNTIYMPDIQALRFALPPTADQASIVSVLDLETAKIDALVDEQRRLIELLKEKRQAVISHAVTKGLNPDAPMKPSGIEWLGDVPAHWVQSRIKHNLWSLIDTEHKTAPFFDDGQFLVVRTTNIKDGKLLLDGAKYTDVKGFRDWSRRGTPQPGDIMFTREAPAGEACLVPEDVKLCMGQRTVLMQVKREVLDPGFALWSLYGGLASEFISCVSQGATVTHFNMSDIRNIPIMLPPVSEQREIATLLSSELCKLDILTAEAQRAIDLLQERRTALISAAVTGQIDVRGVPEMQPA
jgi:type I restriction enzyme S subunit